MIGVVARAAVVGQGEQHDQVDAARDQRGGARQHAGGIAALEEIADEHQVRLGRPQNLRLAVGERRVDVGAAAELHAEQDLDRVCKLIGQVEDCGVEADELRVDHRQRSHHGGEDR